jgi:hypothetical protein
MTTYIFQPTTTDQFVDWSDPAAWTGGAVPDTSSAEVVFPVVALSDGGTNTSFISVAFDESYLADSVQLASNSVTIDGDLTAATDFAIQAEGEIDLEGGTLDAGTLENDGSNIQGYGQLTTTGVLTNNSEIVGEDLTLTLGGLVNGGTLVAAFGNLVVQVSSGFAQFSDGSLTGGAYIAGYGGNTVANSNTLYFNIGGVVTTDGAAMTLNSGGGIDSFDSASWSYVPLQSTLNLISAAGSLSLAGQSYDWETALTVAGSLSLLGGAADLSAPQLIVDPGGSVSGAGIILSPIDNSGAIFAGLPSDPGSGSAGGELDIQGVVTGDGTIEISPKQGSPVTLELGGPDSNNVSFADGTGTLQLDDPSVFSGTITLGGLGDQIILAGISYASVTGYTYAVSATGGALTIDGAGTAYTLNFAGDYDSSSFTLSAGPQLVTSSPTSLLITLSSPDILWQNTDGTVAVWQMQNDALVSGDVVADPGPSWHIEGTGDFNADGHTGIVLQHNNGDVAIWEINGGGQISQAAEVANPGPTWHVVGTGDFSPGGKSDILLQNNNGEVAIWDMNGDQISQAGVVADPGPSWHIEGTGDFNADGHTDIVLQNNNGDVAVWEMNGGGQISQAAEVANPGPTWHVVGTGDFSPSGKSDILLQNNNGEVAIWDMNGDQISQAGVVNANPGPSWHIEGAGDFYGDGKTDILWQNASGQAAIWEMNGTNIISAAVVGANPGPSWQAIGLA